MTPEGELRSALISNPHADHIHEVFAHPSTALELCRQSDLGILRVNGRSARAETVDALGNGDSVVRLTLLEQPGLRLAA